MILLDTHVVWWLAYQPEKLSRAATDAIRNAQQMPLGIAVSCVSLYEMTWLLERGRLTISTSPAVFLRELNRRFNILPVDGAIAVDAARIPAPFHGDPMDRLIIATALASNHTLVTADNAMLTSGLCQLLW